MKKSLLFVSAGLRIGGVERALIALLEQLDPKEFNITVFLYSHDGELMDNLPKWVRLLPAIPDYECIDQPISQVLFKKPCIAMMRLLSKFVDGCLRLVGKRGSLLARSVRYCQSLLPHIPGNYDVAISFLCPHDIVVNKVRSQLKLGWIHTDYMREPVDVRFERPVWLALDRLAAVTGSAARAFEKKFEMSRNSVVVMRNLIDAKKIKTLAQLSEGRVDMPRIAGSTIIFTSARLAYEKGIDLAIEAAAILKRSGLDFKWYVAGSGIEEIGLRRLINRLDLEDCFVLLGTRINPYVYMVNCDIYVQPSRYEGFCIAILEAQSLGCPIVTTRFDAVSEIIQDGVNGVCADATPQSIAEQVRILAKNKEFSAAISMNAKHTAVVSAQDIDAFRTLVS